MAGVAAQATAEAETARAPPMEVVPDVEVEWIGGKVECRNRY